MNEQMGLKSAHFLQSVSVVFKVLKLNENGHPQYNTNTKYTLIVSTCHWLYGLQASNYLYTEKKKGWKVTQERKEIT